MNIYIYIHTCISICKYSDIHITRYVYNYFCIYIYVYEFSYFIYLYIKYMFPQNACYIKNNIGLTQVMGCIL